MVRRREYHRLLSLVVAVVALLLPSAAHAGYTHYWKWRREPDEPRVERAVSEMRRIVESKKEILEVGDAAGLDVLIVFNGVGPNGHEPFRFPGRPDLDFVKTEQKPYDAVVTACLIVARDHFTEEELVIASDGTWDAWRAGRDLYEQALERQPNDPLNAHPADLNGAGDDLDEPPAPPAKDDPARFRAIGITLGVIGALVVVRLLTAGRS